MTKSKITAYGSAAAMLAAGLVAGGVLASTMSANAAGSAPTPSASANAAPTNPNPGDLSRPQRPDETLLTGDTATKVKAAALARYPGATVQRLETDSDGVYEAHLVSGGKELIVQVDKAFAVTGLQSMGGHGGFGGPDQAPGATTQSG